MSCKKIQNWLPDYLMHRLTPHQKKTIEDHLSQCESCRNEVDSLLELWHDMDMIPVEEPGPALRSRFYAMLEHERRALELGPVPWRHRMEAWINSWWPRGSAVQAAFAAGLLCIGILAGTLVPSWSPRGEIMALRHEIKDMQQMVSISMLRESSSVERLKGVTLTSRIKDPDSTLVSALIRALERDPSINVRLAAADAMFLFADQPEIRQSLIQSLNTQESPLVQIAIIDLLVRLQEKRALDALHQLVDTQEINPIVKEKARRGLESLI